MAATPFKSMRPGRPLRLGNLWEVSTVDETKAQKAALEALAVAGIVLSGNVDLTTAEGRIRFWGSLQTAALTKAANPTSRERPKPDDIGPPDDAGGERVALSMTGMGLPEPDATERAYGQWVGEEFERMLRPAAVGEGSEASAWGWSATR